MAHLVKSETKSSDKNRWATRLDCFERAQALFGTEFQIDVCAEFETSKCGCFYGPPGYKRQIHKHPRCIGSDTIGENRDWGDSWWCNPPFDLKRDFIVAARENRDRGHSGMMLLPYEPCTKWFRELVMPHATAVYVPDGRYNFMEPDGVTPKSGVNFPSCFVLWTPHHNGGEAKIIHISK